jgi:hypothetical protein
MRLQEYRGQQSARCFKSANVVGAEMEQTISLRTFMLFIPPEARCGRRDPALPLGRGLWLFIGLRSGKHFYRVQ